MQIDAAPMENNMEGPQKIKNELPYDPVIPLLNISEETHNTNSKEYMHPYVHCSIIFYSQDM